MQETDYNISFPFLPDEVLEVEDNEVVFYRNAVDPDRPGLYFIGLLQPLGATMPLAEIQSKWIAGLLSGEMAVPDAEAMRREIRRTREQRRQRYHRAARHTIQVDFHDYMMTIEREMKRGRRQMRRLRKKGAVAA